MNGSWSRKKIARGEAVPVEFTLEQRDLILGRHQGNIPLAPLVDEEDFRAALVKDESVVVKMTLDDSNIFSTSPPETPTTPGIGN